MKLVKDTSDEVHKNQMSLLSETDEVIKFLEQAGEKAILNESAVQCRLSACHSLFSVLNAGEDNVDYILNNLDLLIHRYRNKNPNMQSNTVKVYKSRVKNSLEDYSAWLRDAAAWEKSVSERSKLQMGKERRSKSLPSAPKPREPKRAHAHALSDPQNGNGKNHSYGVARKVAFPIRPDFNLEITLPAEGLSLKELLRLGLFLFPYCKDAEGRSEMTAWALSQAVAN